MTTRHIQQYWFAGDDWRIDATLLDANGNPFDLTSAVIKWTMLDASSEWVLNENDANISVTNALAGQCSIMLTAGKTSPLLGGTYTDYIRIISGGITSTLSYGLINVHADPWLAVEAAVTTQRRTYTKLRRVS